MTEQSKHERGAAATHAGERGRRSERANQDEGHDVDAASSMPDAAPDSDPSTEFDTDADVGEAAPSGSAGTAATFAAGTAENTVDFRDRWLRAEADLQNYRRRSQRDLEEAVRFAEERLLLEMISVLDDLERALAAARESGPGDAWVQGVELVANRMRDVMAREGATPVDPVGQRFDPALHEALLEIEPTGDAVPGTVAQVVRTGYQYRGRALRAARVVVVKDAG